MDATYPDYQPPKRDRVGHKLKDLPRDEMPRERLLKFGAHTLSDSELIAILFRSGTATYNVKDLAQNLLHEFDGLEGLGRASAQELMGVNGIKSAKATTLVAALELGRRASQSQGPKKDLSKPAAIAELMLPRLRYLGQEELWVILLSKRRRYRGEKCVYRGNIDQIGIKPSVVVSSVIARQAPCFAVVHNHPSGDPQPSSADILATKKIAKAAKGLDIEFVDHVVLGGDGFVSMRHSRMVDFT